MRGQGERERDRERKKGSSGWGARYEESGGVGWLKIANEHHK